MPTPLTKETSKKETTQIKTNPLIDLKIFLSQIQETHQSKVNKTT